MPEPEKVKVPFSHVISTHIDLTIRSLCGKTVKVVGRVKTPLGEAYRVQYNGTETQILACHTEPVSLP